ncbi:MAG: magnesium/cobalt transporter CorA [Desulfovibrionales bacterium]
MRLLKLQGKKAGQSPGTLIYVGEPRSHKISITEIHYNGSTFDLKVSRDIATVRVEPARVNWLHVDGLHDLQILRDVGAKFSIHPLTLEDIANTNQRPKMEEYDEYIFIVLKWPGISPEQGFSMQQVCIMLGKGFVLTFQEEKGNIFQNVLGRLESKRGRIRTMGPDYLTYALMDNLVDHYFVLLEDLGNRIDRLQDAMVENPGHEHLHDIFALKKDLTVIRHAIWPMREMFANLERLDKDVFFTDATDPYLRDLYDHCMQILEAVESQRETTAAMHELYLSLVGNRTNDVMKVLTIMASIFIPLTFIAGVYGMNFESMPELEWRFGYYFSLGLMLAVALGLLVFFKRKKWF